MNLKNLSDDVLHEKMIALASDERQITVEILHHLREISTRRLFAVMGYSSLWGYCIEELHYSEAAAQRRISAMKLMAEFPEVEIKLRRGSLSLSTASQIQSACKTKPERKKDLIAQLEGKSKRQVEKILAAIDPKAALPERRRVLSATETELRFVISDELERKLERIKALTSRRVLNPSYAELIEIMADIVLDRIDPEQNRPSPPPAEVKEVRGSDESSDVAKRREDSGRQPRRKTRYISIETKRALYRRAGSRCEYVSPVTHRRCEETKLLEVDHLEPFALGGSNKLENCQLVCATHNRLRAIQVYGLRKMRPFLSS